MSNNNKNPPFYVGQRVVALKTSNPNVLGLLTIKGEVYTVYNCTKCHCNNQWIVQLVEFAYTGDEEFKLCHLKNVAPYFGGPARYFAPIEPRHQDVEIAEELLKEPVPETLDKLKPVLS